TQMAFRSGYDVRVVPPLLAVRRHRGRRVRTRRELDGLNFGPLQRWQAELGQPVLVADAELLDWRYLRHPRRSYRLLVHEEDGKVSGYAVDRAFRTPLVRWVVDFQGRELWARGPAWSPLPGLLAWPPDVPVPPRSYRLPRLEKHYDFFATPCSSMANDGDPWSYLTLAATDFA